MTRTEIMFNYAQAIRQAEKLESLSKKMQRLATEKMLNTISRLQTSWQSDNSHVYYQKAMKVAEEIRVTANNLMQIARAIRTTAEAVKNAEMRALEIARTRAAADAAAKNAAKVITAGATEVLKRANQVIR